MDKINTFKVASIIIISIAFVETSSPIWTTIFWRDFLLNIMIYVPVSIVTIMIFSPVLDHFISKKQR